VIKEYQKKKKLKANKLKRQKKITMLEFKLKLIMLKEEW